MSHSDVHQAPEENRKDVLIVAGSGDYTGACKMAHLYGLAFRRAGWNALFITGDRPSNGSRCLADELLNDKFEVIEESGFFQLQNLALIRRIKTFVKEFGPDFILSVIQVDLKIVGPVARSTGIPYIVSDQTIHNFYGLPPLRWLKHKAFGWELRQAAGVIASSTAVQKQAIEEFHCHPNKVAVVPNGIDTRAFQGDIAAAENLPARRAGCLRLLNVGRIDPQKGQKVLVEAIAKCSQKGILCEVLLAGDASANSPASLEYAEELRALVSKLGIADYVHFLSWRSDIEALHRAADVYIHSAIWEGFPLAPLEAMASGMPVIQTDCVGWPEGFEQHVHGMVVKTGDPDALSEGIIWAAKLSPDERHAAGEKARELAETRYDISVTGKQFAELCGQFLHSKD